MEMFENWGFWVLSICSIVFDEALHFPGIHVGNAITLPLASLLCEYGFAGGWPSIFYIFGEFFLVIFFGFSKTVYLVFVHFSGIFTLAWVLLWGCLAYNGPTSHPRITEPEQKYILASLKGQVEEGSRVRTHYSLLYLGLVL